MTGPASAEPVRAMLEARSVAVVGASPRAASFGARLMAEVSRSAGPREIHLVNPRYAGSHGYRASLREIPEPVDLVLLAVPDRALEDQLVAAAHRGDRSAVIFGSAHEPATGEGPGLRQRLATHARGAGMAVCGAGCMGFVNVGSGLRAIGYLEHDPLPSGPVALVTHSGSVFSALLRTRRRIAFSLAVSSGQELVTTTADYLDYALDRTGTAVVALLLETMREPARLRAALARAAAADVAVVALTVGASRTGRRMVAAHSGALAGDDAAWEALFDETGVHRVGDLDEMADTLELFAAGRRAAPAGPGGGIATVHDSGAERALAVDVAEAAGVAYAQVGPATLDRLAGLLDPGLEPANPLDVWGTGRDTASTFAATLLTFAQDPAVAAVALSVDLVEELDGDPSYPEAVLAAWAGTPKPVAVLSHLSSAVDPATAARLRAAGVPVLEGTRTGMRALRHLLEHRAARCPAAGPPADPGRRSRARDRVRSGRLGALDTFALLASYGVVTVPTLGAHSAGEAVAAADGLGYPVVLKTDEPVAHKSDVDGVRLGLTTPADVRRAAEDLCSRLGPRLAVSRQVAAGVEVALGVVCDPHLGPLVVAGAGGTLVELLADRAVALPPVGQDAARRMLDRLRLRPLLDGLRGAPAVDLDALVAAVCAVSALAVDLAGDLEALDINPLVCGPGGAVAVDALLVPQRRSADTGRRAGG